MNSVLRRLVVLLSLVMLTMGFSAAGAESARTAAGLALDTPWKIAVYRFASTNLQHTAWGVGHAERDYLLTLALAERELVTVDPDVLFAAAFLHDMGVFSPYLIDGAEHSHTAADRVAEVLLPAGFPATKLADVKALILAHMFYAEVPGGNDLARCFHDADTLDFLGNIGVARILSISTRHRWAENLPSALATIEKFQRELPETLQTASGRKIAGERVAEALAFVRLLKAESVDGAAL